MKSVSEGASLIQSKKGTKSFNHSDNFNTHCIALQISQNRCSMALIDNDLVVINTTSLVLSLSSLWNINWRGRIFISWITPLAAPILLPLSILAWLPLISSLLLRSYFDASGSPGHKVAAALVLHLIAGALLAGPPVPPPLASPSLPSPSPSPAKSLLSPLLWPRPGLALSHKKAHVKGTRSHLNNPNKKKHIQDVLAAFLRRDCGIMTPALDWRPLSSDIGPKEV